MKTIALIGCGRISNRHIEAIEEHPDLKIAVACDTNPARAEAVAQRTGARATTDMFDIAGVDIASILTPSGMHPRHTSDIAEQTEVPSIVTEKPLSITERELLELFRRVDAAGKRLLPVFQNRYNPLIQHIRQLIRQGTLGTVYSVICNVLWNRNHAYFTDYPWHGTREMDGGVLYTQASHYVDMLLYLFGSVQDARGLGSALRKYEVYDTYSSVLRFQSGLIASLNATVNAYDKNFNTELIIIAENGNIHLSGTNLNAISTWNVKDTPKPNLEFQLTHEYGKGHNTMYRYIAEEKWEMFPSHSEIQEGIRLMENLSYGIC